MECARYRNDELEERLRQMMAEDRAWLGVAKSHEAVAAGLRATLDKLLQPPEREDRESRSEAFVCPHLGGSEEN